MNFQDIKARLQKIEDFYSNYACRDALSKRRHIKSIEQDTRTEFQRDRDRILYSSAFRHLAYKTQVFIYNRNNMLRTRLTHSLEVSQISRSIARILGLNSDLCEAIALAHDIGHAPFGHAGEMVLNELMKDEGGFEHNTQSLRVVDILERKFYQHRGLNLTFATREGIIRHITGYDSPKISSEFMKRNSTLETETICVADRISFNTHDIEDAYIEGLLNIDDMCKALPFLGELKARVKEKYPNIAGIDFVYRWKSLILKLFVNDVIKTSIENIEKSNIDSFEKVIDFDREIIIDFSKEMQTRIKAMEKYLTENVYFSNLIIRMNDKARYLIKEVFRRYLENFSMLPDYFLRVYTDSELKKEKKRIICDFVASKSDQSLIKEYDTLFNPAYQVI